LPKKKPPSLNRLGRREYAARNLRKDSDASDLLPQGKLPELRGIKGGSGDGNGTKFISFGQLCREGIKKQ